jgi:DNA invertase Pin-like site-specific DNA recombinase
MQENIKKYCEKYEQGYSKGMRCINNGPKTAVYADTIGEIDLSKLDQIYEYCHRNGYEKIEIYNDNGKGEFLMYPSFYMLLDSLASGYIETVVLYSVYDISEGTYEFLYHCKLNNIKIELVEFNKDTYYSNEELQVLKYIANYNK